MRGPKLHPVLRLNLLMIKLATKRQVSKFSCLTRLTGLQETITLVLSGEKKVVMDSAVLDYMYRSPALEHWNVLRFFTESYERGKPKTLDTHYEYLDSHPQKKKSIRVVRHKDHNCIPNFLGKPLPRFDEEHPDLHCASMLQLLKPWRTPSDLKGVEEGWLLAYKHFMDSTTDGNRRIVSNIQYLYRSKEAADEERKEDALVAGDIDEEHREDVGMDVDEPELPQKISLRITEELIEQAKLNQRSSADRAYARAAVLVGHMKGLFNGPTVALDGKTPLPASGEDFIRLQQWRDAMKSDRQEEPTAAPQAMARTPAASDVIPLTTMDLANLPSDESEAVEEALTAVEPDQLRSDQRRAYDIVKTHLDNSIDGKNPPQLLMQIQGEGGTGKSKVIQTITAYFAARGVKHTLQKMAYTGIAASLIEGRTTHTALGVGKQTWRNPSDQQKAKLATQWEYTRYIIIDEISMIDRSFFAVLSRNVAMAKLQKGTSPTCLPFGGVNIIICGDFHQFPPIVSQKEGALYHPIHGSVTEGSPNVPKTPDQVKNDLSIAGRAIYEKFQTVVLLTEQMRVTDEVWRRVLTRLRNGEMRQEDIAILRSLVLMNPECLPTDFTSDLWRDACLVTPRHSVRERWNDAAVERLSLETGAQRFIVCAENTIGAREPNMKERLEIASMPADRRRELLPDEISIVKGMKVMVTLNINTDIDVVNGTRGEIVDIVLDPEEEAIDPTQRVVRLKKPPLCVLVKLGHTRLECLPGLEEGVVPVECIQKTFRLAIPQEGTKTVSTEIPSVQLKANDVQVRRRQLPITAAYAFTDYRAQGQTLSSVIVDIAKPPSGSGLTLFNLYVALSRSSGRDTIRLLRDFDEDTFFRPIDPALVREDERLAKLNEKTKRDVMNLNGLQCK